MSHLATIFFDLGGVCLTNGWDTGARRSAAAHFSLDFKEMEERHQTLEDAFERGERSLDTYLDRVIFHRRRAFSRDAVVEFMLAQSQPHASVLGLIRRLASARSYRLATINNESRELNRHRIDTFRLHEIFGAFFSSCYVGVRKPEARIYEIALDVMQADPATSVFVDDREENVEGARTLGMRTLHVTDVRNLATQLLCAGIEVPGAGPVSGETAAREEGLCSSD